MCNTSLEKKGSKRDIVIATKFAAYPWRLTPGQFVNACRYLFVSINTLSTYFTISYDKYLRDVSFFCL